jgi:hypothetical protein
MMSRFLVPVLLLLLLPGPSLAVTYVVKPDRTGDFPTIQAAIEAAVDGDIVELADGRFTGPGNRDIEYLGKAITVRSRSGDPATCVIDCLQQSPWTGRGFRFSGGVGRESVLAGVTITNGETRQGAGVVCGPGTSPTIRNCDFNDNVAEELGGGIYCAPRSAPLIRSCSFRGNEAVNGAGIYCHDASPTIVNCTFTLNHSGVYGGGLYAWIGSSLTIVNCTFANNASDWLGGAMYFFRCSAEIRNTVVAFNTMRGIRCREADVDLVCTNLWVGAVEWNDDCLSDQRSINGNMTLDPLFCDPRIGSYTLQANSPCAPENNLDCGLIGAWLVGCDPAATAKMTWGRIKAIYRD